MKKLSSIMSNLHYHFKLDFQKVDQHTRDKWLIHGTKHRKDNQFQSPQLYLVDYPSRESKRDIKESEGNQDLVTYSIQYSKGMVQGRKHPGRCAFAEPELFIFRKPKCVIHDKNNGHKNSNNGHDYHYEIDLYQGISKRKT